MSDEPGDKLKFHPWPDILKRERREMLVPELLFSTGVTTLTGPSGGGKTTLAASTAFTVASTEGIWGGKLVKHRGLLWVLGEGQDDMRPIYEAWTRANSNSGIPQGGFLEEAVDLSSQYETNKLIKLIDSAPPTLIVLDALADNIGDLDDDKSKDMNRAYRNIWRVVRKNDHSLLVPHHAGWDKDRERGSTAIRAKSDIVVHVVKFDPAAGFIQLKHNKRRGGAKLDKIIYGVKLVTVPGYPQPIPIVTGVLRSESDVILGQKFRISANAQLAFDVLANQFPRGALRQEWLEVWQKEKGGPNAKGASEDTFDRAKDELIAEGLVEADGKGKGAIYRVRAATEEVPGATTGASPQDSPQDSPHSAPLKGGAEEMRRKVSANDPQWSKCGGSNHRLWFWGYNRNQ